MSKVIVISSDAMVGEDLEYFKTLSSYKSYFAGGAEITNVSSIYPSVTFPAHATMMTGMYPDRHGVFSNMQLIPGSDPTPWQWESSFLHCSDIFRAAKEAGKTTAAVFWPVTAGNPAIDYHIADYWAQSDDETIRQAFARAGASEEVLRIADRHMHLFAGCEREHPQRDAFGMACAADIVEQFQPDLLLVHPANIDAARHAGGVFGPHIQTALDQLNDWIEGIGQAARQAGSLEELYMRVKSKRYPLARARRLVLAAFLGVKEEGLPKLPPYLRVLGMTEVGQRVLRQASPTLPLASRPGDFQKLGGPALELFQLEARAGDLYGLCCPVPQPCGRDYREKIVKTMG